MNRTNTQNCIRCGRPYLLHFFSDHTPVAFCRRCYRELEQIIDKEEAMPTNTRHLRTNLDRAKAAIAFWSTGGLDQEDNPAAAQAYALIAIAEAIESLRMAILSSQR